IKNKGKDKDKNKEKAYEFIPTEMLTTYGCADVDATFRIGVLQRRRAEPWMNKLYDHIARPLSIVTRHIERHGVRINIEEINELEAKYQKKIDKKRKTLSNYVQVEDFNPNSNPQMQNLLFETLKLFTPFKTKSGKPSTDAKSFELIEKTQGKKSKPVGNGTKVVIKTLLKKVVELRTMQKMKSTYLTGMRLLADENSRVHTSYMTTGTVTSRSASRNPNLQNIPNDPIFRSLFIAGYGRFLIPADYSQIEARIMPYIAGEIPFIKKFAEEGFDVHTYNSALYRDKDIADVTKEERKQDKGITFGVNYGRSYKSIANEYDMTLESVKRKVETYYRKNPMIDSWKKNRVKESRNELPMLCKNRTDFYVENPLKRRRHFSLYNWIDQPEIKAVSAIRDIIGEDEVSENYRLYSLRGGAERQAVNFPIQSYAAEILTMATYRVYKRLKKEVLDAFLVLTVHDCIVLDTHEAHSKQALNVLMQEMQLTQKLRDPKTGETVKLRFPIDANITPVWEQ
ncbi:MAG: hypothetical protein KAS39_08405, partial [Actinomycetia bacterium]|nr:hypothetical protein [Actinomycetes bacterium]